MKSCLPTATSTYLAVEMVSDPGFVRNAPTSTPHQECGGGKFKGELCLLFQVATNMCALVRLTHGKEGNTSVPVFFQEE